MPVISEEAATEQRKRASRAPRLLLLLPLIIVLVLGAATVQPLELGPIVIVTEFLKGDQKGCHVSVEPYPAPILGRILIQGRTYRWRGNGMALATELHYFAHSLGWFWGQRVQLPRTK